MINLIVFTNLEVIYEFLPRWHFPWRDSSTGFANEVPQTWHVKGFDSPWYRLYENNKIKNIKHNIKKPNFVYTLCV